MINYSQRQQPRRVFAVPHTSATNAASIPDCGSCSNLRFSTAPGVSLNSKLMRSRASLFVSPAVIIEGCASERRRERYSRWWGGKKINEYEAHHSHDEGSGGKANEEASIFNAQYGLPPGGLAGALEYTALQPISTGLNLPSAPRRSMINRRCAFKRGRARTLRLRHRTLRRSSAAVGILGAERVTGRARERPVAF